MPLEKGPEVPVDRGERSDCNSDRKEPTITTSAEVSANAPSTSPSQQPRQTLKFDAEYARWREPFGDKVRMPPFETPHAIRRFNDTFMRAVWARIPPQPSITRTKHTCTSYDGVKIYIARFAAAEHMRSQQPAQSAVLYIHGGGMVAVGVDIFAPQLARLAAESGVQLFAVEYRLAPEHPDPTPAEDCYAALRWLSAHAAGLGVDPTRLGVMGDSAGGGLAAGVALMARDRGLAPPVKAQILVYPMLDDRSVFALSAASPLERFATLPVSVLRVCWEAYLGKEKAGRADADVSPYAAPGRAGDLHGLPSTYIDVGGLDVFRDECAAFAARLAAADVEVEFHLFPGVPHAFESAGDISVTKRAVEGRIRWMRAL
ncbi:hypothetical protein F5Y05DRAFT_424815 [Hypoxylon sp. FL0543]|nr:hypothetical protein F5Y05DRAFT_424815 [Hypoxylon sp. FL0543]